MTIVEGQIETLKNLKNSLAERGLSEFESIGQINKFQQSYSAVLNDNYPVRSATTMLAG